MSHRMFGLIAVFVLMLLVTAGAQAQLRTLDGRDDTSDPDVLTPIWEIGSGSKVAGSWLASGSYSVDVGCDGSFEYLDIPVTDAHTFNDAGGHVITNPANPNSGHGTWVKTGPRQITVRDLNFGVDATPNGQLTSKAVITMVVDFDQQFETATTTFEAKVYFPDEDPLDPAGPPFVCTEGQHDSFKRVTATE